MDYPSILICNGNRQNSLPYDLEFSYIGNFVFSYSKEVADKLLILDTPSYTVFCHVNIGCKNVIIDMNHEEIERLLLDGSPIISNLQWGFLVYVSKQSEKLVVINDIYGIYPLYYTVNNYDFTLSNDYDRLAKIQKSLTVNKFGVYDYLLFNYTIKSRTLFQEISQIEGNSILVHDLTGCKREEYVDIGELLSSQLLGNSVGLMCDRLINNVKCNLDNSLINTVPLTGGFDSKVIISILLSQGFKFNTFTFGVENSSDHVAAVLTAGLLNIEHRYIGMPNDVLNNMESELRLFLRNHPNAPMFDTLIYYLSSKESLPAANLVTGQMGGELMIGPVLISELITTRTFALLSTIFDVEDLYSGLKAHASQIGLIDMPSFSREIEEYILLLRGYINEHGPKENLNIVRFLLNETYAKFFGTVFSNLFGKFNIINPLIDIGYLKYIFASKYRFTNKRPFKKAPIYHFISRRLYPKLILRMYPDVLKTRMDRGYNLEDFLHWYYFPKPIFNYIKRHLFRNRKPRNTVVIRYSEEIRLLIMKLLPRSIILEWDFLDKEAIVKQLDKLRNGELSKFQEQKLVQLLTIHLFVDHYSEQISKDKI